MNTYLINEISGVTTKNEIGLHLIKKQSYFFNYCIFNSGDHKKYMPVLCPKVRGKVLSSDFTLKENINSFLQISASIND